MRYVCLHGHFYQPPRENPWLGKVGFQPSAAPFHDWNERITAECYSPNTAARILDHRGEVDRTVNNYARISFNFGPTLLSWLADIEPEVYAQIQSADRAGQKKFGGHGPALAQVYNHVIMPLANRRDKELQVHWGIRDFEARFGRFPEGMWLAETAVDTETLEVLAEQGIKFTILAPHQAAGPVDPKQAYLCRLPSGRQIALFFYDGHIAQEIAFGPLLKNGENLAKRLTGVFDQHRRAPQLVSVATDGETYGHHHRFGEMALAYCLDHLERHHLARLTIFGEFLALYPPKREIKIRENSSWSCCHGVERWRSDCGCETGGAPGWNQAWRGPLREALNWLRDELDRIFECEGKKFTHDPWATRFEYIEYLLGRRRPQDERLHQLLEMQKFAQFMFTSCGWFFADPAGLETSQLLAYAARAIELSGADLEPEFCRRLKQVKSNRPEAGDGEAIYQRTKGELKC